MRDSIKIAYHPTGVFKHIDDVDKAFKGLLCGCYCLKCNEQLIAVVDVFKRTKHFRHHTNLTCNGSQETALHELGKQILVTNSEIVLPNAIGRISYTNPVAESRLECRRPDVSAIFDGQQIFFEIRVSHEVDSDKEKFFVEGKHKSVEIDLRGCENLSFDQIENIVLNHTKNKKVFYWQEEAAVLPQSKVSSNNDWIWKLAFLAIGFFFVRSLFHLLIKTGRP